MSAYAMTGTTAWSDTDASGRFHYTAAYRWAENAEHALYRSVISDVDIARFPRRATSATYEKPLVAGDEYVMHLDVDRLGNSSITYSWTVTAAGDVCVRGTHTVVHVDDAGRAAPVPIALRLRLESTINAPTV
ncbi:acyl-CoA thioesterase [Microbacterium sp. A196]|uniref:acyl-CoA thioesterase n=1 Tax=Microbacterium sp. A196 TaxID=3457320 RepID=UPI003FD40AEB